VMNRVKNASVNLPNQPTIPCSENETFRITDSAKGFFTSKDLPSNAYLYSDCDQRSNGKIQGLIVIFNEKTQAHFAYGNQSDVKISKIADLDGNSLDELAIFSHERIGKNYRTAVRIVEFSARELKKLGAFELQKPENILIESKIYAEKGKPPKFYESKFQTDGYHLKNIEFQKLITPSEDKVGYSRDASQNGYFKHLAFITFILQAPAFIGLIGLVIYQFLKAEPTERQEKIDLKAEKTPPITEDNLPKLKPINCQSCGAGVPLREGEMICPSCGTKTKAPESYFDVAKKRDEINAKIRHAAAYLKRAKILGSNWVRSAIGLSAIWLAVALVGIFVLTSKGNFEPYQSYIFGNSGFRIFGAIGSFTTLFWVVSLICGFLIWSPKVKKNLPKIDLPQNIGEAENANCANCGGAISYQRNDLATVCGYCGVETYRAKLAWKVRNLTNEAHKKAAFSLIEAKNSVESAIDEIIGTPKVFAFLLILVAMFGGVFWLISAAFELLPSGVKDFLEAIGDIFNAF
jgi:predicted RNA-binding Zn-ribbon protein involved in translation (DUF1610 family)